MSEAVRRLVEASRPAAVRMFAELPNSEWLVHEIFNAIAAVEAELNAVPAVTDKTGFDGRSTDYPDWVENYR